MTEVGSANVTRLLNGVGSLIQAHLRDFAIPQRGVFAIGRAFFTDAAT